MATNPDPSIELATTDGDTRTLAQWCTLFHLCLVILPDRLEASAWVPVAEKIFATFGDADCHTAFVVTSNAAITKRILGDAEQEWMTFVDPDRALVNGLGLERLPALVHLRQDTSLGSVAQGWDPKTWQSTVKEIAAAMAWTTPELAATGGPAPTEGWLVSAL
jgi:hypothetical protein